MNNVLADIAGMVSPEAIAAGTNPELRVGHINHGASLYGAFVVDSEKTGLTQVQTISAIAESGITFEEFSKACKDAQALADTVDTGLGFKAVEDAKGQDKYGPKRRLLNQRLSEAKQLFGVFKTQPDLLKEQGYWNALAIAREHLATRGTKWDGSVAPSDEQKAAGKAFKQNQTAIVEAMSEFPIQADETRAEYLARIDSEVEKKLEALEADSFNKGVQSLHEAFCKKHGTEMLEALFAFHMGQTSVETLESAQHFIQEELVMRTLSIVSA